MPPGGPDEVAGGALAFGDRQRDVLEQGQAAEQRADLEGADETAFDARGARQMGDVLAAQQDASGARLEHAGDQIDEAGLAGAVGPDQRMAGAAFEPEVDVARHPQRAEAPAQALGLHPGGAPYGPPISPRRRSVRPTP